MTNPADPLAWPSAPDTPLRRALLMQPGELYAVVDGAAHDDLPARMRQAGLHARSLFLEHKEPDAVRAGPFLVSIRPARALDHVLDVLGEEPQAVFWRWDRGEAALFRHLRHLNLVEMPAESPPSWAPRVETVLFRHWDPDVLAPILPLLTEGQRLRVVGHALAIVLYSWNHGGLCRVPALERWAEPPHGLLRFSPAQIEALTTARLAAARRAVRLLLRDLAQLRGSPPASAPRSLQDLSDAGLDAQVLQAERSGTAIGLRSDRGHQLWAGLAFLTFGRSENDPEILHALRQAGPDVDAALEAMLALAESDDGVAG